MGAIPISSTKRVFLRGTLLRGLQRVRLGDDGSTEIQLNI